MLVEYIYTHSIAKDKTKFQQNQLKSKFPKLEAYLNMQLMQRSQSMNNEDKAVVGKQFSTYRIKNKQ